MPETITARLTEPIDEPELSRMWESERTTFNPGTGDGIDTTLSAPELVIESRGPEVRLSFPGPGNDPGHAKLRSAFERAIHRFRPDVGVEWS